MKFIKVVLLSKIRESLSLEVSIGVCDYLGVLSDRSFDSPILCCREGRQSVFLANARCSGSGKHGCMFPKLNCILLFHLRLVELDIRHRAP